MTDTTGELQPVPEPEQKPPIALSEIKLKKVPDRFKVKTKGEAAYQVTDPHSGLPIKNDAARFDLVSQLGLTMRDKIGPNGWACIYSDIDQLKLVNERFDRDAGDTYIQWGATVPLQTLDEKVKLSDRAYAIPVRAGDRADEVVIWFFKLTPSEIAQLRTFVEKHGVPDQVVLIPDEQCSTHTFSSSLGIVTSENPRLKKSIDDTREWVKEKSSNLPFELHTEVEDLAAKFATEEKIAKDLERIPFELLFEPNHMQDFWTLISSLGGGRMSIPILELLNKMVSIKTAITIDPEKYATMLKTLGMSEEEIKQKLSGATSPKEKTELLIEMARSIFGTPDDEIKPSQ